MPNSRSARTAELLATALAVAIALLALYIAIFGSLIAQVQRGLLLVFTMVMVFMTRRGRAGDKGKPPSAADWLLSAAVAVAFGYIVVNAFEIAKSYSALYQPTAFELALAVAAVLLVLEATRRLFGGPLTVLVMISLLYAIYGAGLPAPFGFRPYTFPEIARHLFYSTLGIFGDPVGVTISVVALFIVFSAFLDSTGAGKTFIDLAMGAMGRYHGGPAKTAVVSSGFMGMLSGSVTANVVTTGTFTIPLMKRMGFTPTMAGAVEAIASTGAQIMPPVMGTAAFLMAEYSGFPYGEIAVAAFLPAVLYYASLFMMIHFQSVKAGLGGLPRAELPRVGAVLADGYMFFIPIFILIYTLVVGYSTARAGFYALLTVVAVGIWHDRKLMPWRKMLSTLELAGRGVVVPAVACAAAGIIIGVMGLTGMGLRFSSLVISASGGSLLMAMVLTMIAALILGMGLPTPAAYLIQAVFTIPALIELGAPVIGAHMFAFYFAVISFITPPVAIGAYAAAGISGADPWSTGWTATRIGIVAYVVPYMFVYGPALLMQGSIPEIGWAFVTASLGVISLAAAVIGWLLVATPLWQRAVLATAAITLIHQGLTTDVIGLALMVPVYSLQYAALRRGHTPTQSRSVRASGGG